MNYIIDGPNGLGKTYWANTMEGYKVLHHGIPKIYNRRLMIMQYKWQILTHSKKIILDRCWYSEYVYGQLYRHKSVLHIKDLINLNEFAKKHGYSVKVFIPYNVDQSYEDMRRARMTDPNHPIIPTFSEYETICKLFSVAGTLTRNYCKNVRHVSDYYCND